MAVIPVEANVQASIDTDDTRLLLAFRTWRRSLADDGRQAVADGARAIKEEAERRYRTYPHPPHHRRPPYTPAPAFVGPVGFITGHLAESLRIDSSPRRYSVKVYPSAIYARIHELGGFTGFHHLAHIPPRPTFLPAVVATYPELDAIVYRRMNHAQDLAAGV